MGICVCMGVLLLPCMEWNPNVTQDFISEKKGKKSSRCDSVSVPSKNIIQAVAKYYFQLAGEIAF